MRGRRSAPWTEEDKAKLARLLLVERKSYDEAGMALGRGAAECEAVADTISSRRYLNPRPVVVAFAPPSPPAVRPTIRVRCPNCGDAWNAPRRAGLRYCSNDCRSTASRNDHRYAL